jgi:signal transduction histidine kinase/CheY-like chemotaxis protein
MTLQAFSEKLKKVFPYTELEPPDSPSSWKNDLLYASILGLLALAAIATVPTLVLGFRDGRTDLIIITLLGAGVSIVISVSKSIPPATKLLILLSEWFLIGISLILFMGPFGIGYIYLFLIPLISGLFYSIKTIFRLLGLMTIILSLFSLPVLLTWPQVPFGISFYSMNNWLGVLINFLIISYFFPLFIAILVKYLDNTVRDKTMLSEELELEKQKIEKEKKRAIEMDHLKSSFLANMSHEIRTPMNSILGLSSLLEEAEEKTGEHTEYVQMIQVSGKDLLRLINDIIDISKIESNQISLVESSVNLRKLTDQLIESQKNSQTFKAHKSVDLIISHPEDLGNLDVFIDEVRLRQILNNLILNGLKYTINGFVKLSYDVIQKGANMQLVFEVSDTGVGIPPKEQPLIFKPFMQGRHGETAKNQKQGAGLGLSIVSGIVKLMRGTIELESELDIGSTFRVSLPYKSAGGRSSRTKRVSNEVNFKGKLIYMAEDDAFSTIYMKKILEKTSAETVFVINGQEMLDLISDRVPDLVLLDVNMPVLNGYDTALEIRKTHKDLPIIAQTAYAMPEDRERLISAGCDSVLPKPISSRDLYEAMNEIFTK